MGGGAPATLSAPGARRHRTVVRYVAVSVTRSPLRGRDRELALIGERLDGAVQGRASIVVVEGGPGIGKTRLLAEAAAMAWDRGLPVGSGVVTPGWVGPSHELHLANRSLFESVTGPVWNGEHELTNSTTRSRCPSWSYGLSASVCQ